MSSCNLTKSIPSNQCIGDSLRTINTNFSALDTSICNIPIIVENKNVIISTDSTVVSKPTIELSVETPVVYQNKFSYKSSNITTTNLTFLDQTAQEVYKFPYNLNWNYSPVFGSFETVSNGSGYPQITLFWMTNTNNQATVFATNSATTTNNLDFNDAITALYKEENKLYVGGMFTSVNGVETNKFTIVNLLEGNFMQNLGFTGTLVSNPLSSVSNNLGSTGTVQCITKQKLRDSDLLILGGSFNSSTLGRGLLIYDEVLRVFYSFYVNGVVNNVLVDGVDLYVVGEFNFINYGSTSATEISNQRVYCNGFAKISLAKLFDSPLLSIDAEFAKNTVRSLSNSTKINCVASQEGFVYIGGNFQIQNSQGIVFTKNIAVFDGTTGICNEGWGYHFNRPVLTMCIDNPSSILYIGGEFTTVMSYTDKFVLQKPITEEFVYKRAIAFTLKIPQLPGLLSFWKPRFNDSVSKIIPVDSEVQTFLYFMGQFTEVNENAVGYIAAISKATEALTFGGMGNFLAWNAYLSNAPTRLTNALVKTNSDPQTPHLYVGGNFIKINGAPRRYLGSISNVGQSLLQVAPSVVAFDVGGHVVSQNQNFDLDFSKAVRSSLETSPQGVVNKMVFPSLKDGFKGLTKNQLCRFFIRRPGNSPQIGNLPPTDDSYKSDEVYILGWTVNFDSQKDI
jgi:hypothetical protein